MVGRYSILKKTFLFTVPTVGNDGDEESAVPAHIIIDGGKNKKYFYMQRPHPVKSSGDEHVRDSNLRRLIIFSEIHNK